MYRGGGGRGAFRRERECVCVRSSLITPPTPRTHPPLLVKGSYSRPLLALGAAVRLEPPQKHQQQHAENAHAPTHLQLRDCGLTGEDTRTRGLGLVHIGRALARKKREALGRAHRSRSSRRPDCVAPTKRCACGAHTHTYNMPDETCSHTECERFRVATSAISCTQPRQKKTEKRHEETPSGERGEVAVSQHIGLCTGPPSHATQCGSQHEKTKEGGGSRHARRAHRHACVLILATCECSPRHIRSSAYHFAP